MIARIDSRSCWFTDTPFTFYQTLGFGDVIAIGVNDYPWSYFTLSAIYLSFS